MSDIHIIVDSDSKGRPKYTIMLLEGATPPDGVKTVKDAVRWCHEHKIKWAAERAAQKRRRRERRLLAGYRPRHVRASV